jgi:CoA:oxalate CoA-transferase
LLDHNKVDIFKAGQEHGLGFSYVSTIQDLLEMEQLEARDYFVELEHPVAGRLKYPGPPISPHSPVEPWVYRRAPLLGEHNREVLVERLGYSEQDLKRLQGQGVS